MRRVSVMALFCAAFLTATAVEAQFLSFGVQCTPGAFRACASMNVWNERDPETGHLYLYVQVANVQGTPGYTELPSAGLSRWTLSNLLIDSPTGQVWPFLGDLSPLTLGQLSGNSFVCGSAGNCWAPGASMGVFLESWGVTRTPTQLVGNVEAYISDYNGYLFGCDLDVAFSVWWSPHFSTCGSGRATWRVFDYATGASFRITPETQAGFVYAYGDENNERVLVGCATGMGCTSGIVTPEPVTIILVGSGMAGIAAARGRRRRQPGAPGS